ncbi:hypothetical protein PMIN07_011880 [Paraphaeosphaeria minitans]
MHPLQAALNDDDAIKVPDAIPARFHRARAKATATPDVLSKLRIPRLVLSMELDALLEEPVVVAEGAGGRETRLSLTRRERGGGAR